MTNQDTLPDYLFQGKPCKYGHDGLRYKRGRACVPCKARIHREWVHNNREKVRATNSEYARNNRHIFNRKESARRARELACVALSDWDKIKDFYNKCPKGYEVDHIIPLKGREVCGLHVSWNLQYLTRKANTMKNNTLLPEYEFTRFQS